MADVTPSKNLDLSDVREASYKQARFLLESSSITSGRKDVLHEYVNSDKQVIEDLGLRRRVFNVVALIHGDFYEERKRTLLAALDGSDVGVLIHPFYGTIERVKCRSYTIDENFSNFGVARIKIIFGVSDEIAIPVKAKESINEIMRARTEVLDSSHDQFINLYLADPEIPGTLEAAANKAQGFIDKFEEVVNKTGKITDAVNQLNGKIQGFASQIGSLVQAPQLLADSIEDLFFTLTTVYPATLQTLKTLDGMFDFGSDDPEQLDLDTETIRQVNKNNNSFNSFINVSSLAHAYVSLAQVDTSVDTDAVDDGESDNPQTIDEIEFQEDKLEIQYQTSVEGLEQLNAAGTAGAVGSDQKTLSALANQRTVFTNVLEEIKTKTPDVIQVEVLGVIPLRVLGFQYYGDTENFTLLRSINLDPDVSFYLDDVNLLNDKS